MKYLLHDVSFWNVYLILKCLFIIILLFLCDNKHECKISFKIQFKLKFTWATWATLNLSLSLFSVYNQKKIDNVIVLKMLKNILISNCKTCRFTHYINLRTISFSRNVSSTTNTQQQPQNQTENLPNSRSNVIEDMTKKLFRFMSLYEEIIGIKEVKLAQQSVLDVSQFYILSRAGNIVSIYLKFFSTRRRKIS